MTPGLLVIQSNRLENLVGRLAEDLERNPLSQALTEELVVIQDAAIGKWVTLRIAQKTGVCANMRYLTPGQFIWEMYRRVLDELPEESLFDTDTLQWRVFRTLSDAGFLHKHPSLQQYLASGDATRVFDLSMRIAGLYNNYIAYRMDWLEAWESGKSVHDSADERWQAALWRKLVGETKVLHRGAIYKSFLKSLASLTGTLPERITVFGISSLSPAYGEILRALGEECAVNVYVLNPCRELWNEDVDERAFADKDIEYSSDLMHFEVGHPLLSSMGKQGREFLGFIIEAEGSGQGNTNLFTDPSSDTILHSLQQSILDRSGESGACREGDDSIQIHSCHTPMREVEVLRDRLLRLFERDPLLTPADVLILAPDINEYAPYIEAVFPPLPTDAREQNPTVRPLIPYDISDRSREQVDPVVEGWLLLLDLPRSRFEAGTVMALLQLDPLRETFRFDTNELDTISEWVREAGIRWGRDQAHRKSLGLAETETFTWTWGLNRMLLGSALPRSVAGGEVPIFNDLLPFDSIDGGQFDLLDKFAGFVATLKEWVEFLEISRPMQEWDAGLDTWLNTFFPGRGNVGESREEVRALLREITSKCAAAGFGEKIGYGVIRKLIDGSLESEADISRFLGGGMSFCSMKPMRTLPAKVVCMLGMSDKNFPRERKGPGFDLMRRYYRIGDRAGRMDDRYLFLELLLSAREHLIISYVGQDVRTGKELPASTVVNELLEFLATLGFSGQEQEGLNSSSTDESKSPVKMATDALVIQHPLQAFSPRYFVDKESRLFSFSAEACELSKRLGRGSKEHHDLFVESLPAGDESRLPQEVHLNDLCAFFGNPTKYLFNKRLNVNLWEEEAAIEDEEPLVAGKRETRNVHRALAEALSSGETDRNRIYRLLAAEGKLPEGFPGEAGFASAIAEAEPFIAECRKLLAQDHLPPIVGRIPLGEWILLVEANNITTRGFYQVEPRKLYAGKRISFWIKLLVVSSLHKNRSEGGLQGTLLGLNGIDVFPATKDPEKILKALMGYYAEGLKRPLHFFPNAAWEYAGIIAEDPAATKAATAAALADWDPERQFTKTFVEGDDPYVSRVFFSADEAIDNDEFREMATSIALGAMTGMTTLSFEKKK